MPDGTMAVEYIPAPILLSEAALHCSLDTSCGDPAALSPEAAAGGGSGGVPLHAAAADAADGRGCGCAHGTGWAGGWGVLWRGADGVWHLCG